MGTTIWGREQELASLRDLFQKKDSSLVVIQGRRRIGKSTLATYFGQTYGRFFLRFTGLAPRKAQSNQHQLDQFLAELKAQTSCRRDKLTDWNDAFNELALTIKRKAKVVVLIDEVSWMGQHDPDFSGKLKTAWDNNLKTKNQLILILCGSVSTWIQRNILNSTGFVGRVSLNITLQELPLQIISQFWGLYDERISDFEKTKILCITGCVPKYLEEITKQETAKFNIDRLCFQPSGFLYNEFEHIFSDILGQRSATYKKIVATLADGKKTASQLASKLGIQLATSFLQLLADLELCGFIERDFSFDISSTKSKTSFYRIKDNYLRFALRYLQDHSSNHRRSRGLLSQNYQKMASWKSIMGLQFENLILNHREEVIQALRINPSEVLSATPYFQKKTTRNKGGCQIDMLVQTQDHVAYVCEFKFSERIDHEVINEVKTKMDRLEMRRAWSKIPVLIYEGQITSNALEPIEGYFSKILKLGDLYRKSE